MTKAKPGADGSKLDGDALFEAAMRGTTPLKRKRKAAATKPPPPPPPPQVQARPSAKAAGSPAASRSGSPAGSPAGKPAAARRRPPAPPLPAAPPVPVGLDRRSQDRLRRGRMQIDGRIDLHGCTQEVAHRALHDFIVRAHDSGKRCVLVITGKGAVRADDGIMPDRSMGVLRRQVPMWLRGATLGRLVLAIESATPQHGGGGAYYVLLRRQRGKEA